MGGREGKGAVCRRGKVFPETQNGAQERNRLAGVLQVTYRPAPKPRWASDTRVAPSRPPPSGFSPPCAPSDAGPQLGVMNQRDSGVPSGDPGHPAGERTFSLLTQSVPLSSGGVVTGKPNQHIPCLPPPGSLCKAAFSGRNPGGQVGAAAQPPGLRGPKPCPCPEGHRQKHGEGHGATSGPMKHKPQREKSEMPPVVFLMFLFTSSNTNPLAFEGWVVSFLFLMQERVTLESSGRRESPSPPQESLPAGSPLGGPQGPHLLSSGPRVIPAPAVWAGGRTAVRGHHLRVSYRERLLCVVTLSRLAPSLILTLDCGHPRRSHASGNPRPQRTAGEKLGPPGGPSCP